VAFAAVGVALLVRGGRAPAFRPQVARRVAHAAAAE
jgi:hypothetical protein